MTDRDMICPRCGGVTPSASAMCMRCGAPLHRAVTDEPGPRGRGFRGPSRGGYVAALVCSIIALSLLLVSFFGVWYLMTVESDDWDQETRLDLEGVEFKIRSDLVNSSDDIDWDDEDLSLKETGNLYTNMKYIAIGAIVLAGLSVLLMIAVPSMATHSKGTRNMTTVFAILVLVLVIVGSAYFTVQHPRAMDEDLDGESSENGPHKSFFGTDTNGTGISEETVTWRPDVGYFLFIGGGVMALVALVLFRRASVADAKRPGPYRRYEEPEYRQPPRQEPYDREGRGYGGGPAPPPTRRDEDFIDHPTDERGYTGGRPPAYRPPADERYGDEERYDRGPYDDRWASSDDGRSSVAGYDRGYGGREGYDRGYEGREGYDRGYEGREGYGRGYEGREGYGRGYEGREGYDRGYEGREGYDRGFGSGGDYDRGYEGGRGYDRAFEGRRGYDGGYEGREGYDRGPGGGGGYDRGPGGRGDYDRGYEGGGYDRAYEGRGEPDRGYEAGGGYDRGRDDRFDRRRERY